MPCAASDFKHVGVVGNLLCQKLGVDAAFGIIDQRTNGIVIFVVRERIGLVELLYDLCDIAIGDVVRPIQFPNAVGAVKLPVAAVASSFDLVVGGRSMKIICWGKT